MMKKRLITAIFAMAAAFALNSCGPANTPASNLGGSLADKFQEQSSEEKQEEEDKEEEQPEATKEPVSTPSGVTLGGDFDTDYDGFEYLYCEILMTESQKNEESGKMESQSLYVFVPQGDYVSVNRDYVYVSELGVSFRVSLNPYIQWDQEKYLPEENLEYFVENEHDIFYSAEREKALEVSEIEKQGNGFRVTANWCRYDSWDKEYVPVFAAYFLTELSKNMTVLVEIEVDSSETTGKTNFLVEELESFYGFDIEWSSELAEKKLAAFEASPEANRNLVSTGYMVFELPEGWEQDWNWSDDYSEYCYAPGGDAQFAECVISVEREYMGYGTSEIADLLKSQSDLDDIRDSYVEELGTDGASVVLENYGDTVLGPCLRISFQATMDSYMVYYDYYYMSKDSYWYTVYLNYTSDTYVENPTNIIQNILATAEVR